MFQPNDVAIDDFLDELGFSRGDQHHRAQAVLEETGITNRRKHRIAWSKGPRARAVLEERFAIVCQGASCRDEVRATEREVLDADAASQCWVCQGAINAAAIRRAVETLELRGVRRIVVVGGSPASHEQLRAMDLGSIEIRLVDATGRRNARDAGADLVWAQFVVIWASTELEPRVSNLCRWAGKKRLIVCGRRGIAARAETLLAAAERLECGPLIGPDSSRQVS